MKQLFTIILVFLAGYLTREFVYPRFIELKAPLITTVTYDGERFDRVQVDIKQNNYLAIINNSPRSPMWLISNNKEIATERSFGQGEKLQVLMSTLGDFQVSLQDNPAAILHVYIH
ncbi:MAG: hypothetical protein WCL07_01360 [bacterium]